MGTGTGFGVKLLTGTWQAGPGCPVSGRGHSGGRGDLRSQTGPLPLALGEDLLAGCGCSGRILQPPGSAARARRRGGDRGARQLPPRAAHGGHRVAPALHPLCRRLQSPSCGDTRTGWGGHRRGSAQLSGAPEPPAAPGPFPTAGWVWKGAQPCEQRCCGGERGAEGIFRGAAAMRGTFRSWVSLGDGSWELSELKTPSPLRRGML